MEVTSSDSLIDQPVTDVQLKRETDGVFTLQFNCGNVHNGVDVQGLTPEQCKKLAALLNSAAAAQPETSGTKIADCFFDGR